MLPSFDNGKTFVNVAKQDLAQREIIIQKLKINLAKAQISMNNQEDKKRRDFNLIVGD